MSADRLFTAAVADAAADESATPKKPLLSPEAKGALKAVGAAAGFFGLLCGALYGMNYSASRGAGAGLKDSGLDLSKFQSR